jgi:hypothetical protein
LFIHIKDLFLMAAAVIAAFGIAVAAAVVGPLAITAPAIAQNMKGTMRS